MYRAVGGMYQMMGGEKQEGLAVLESAMQIVSAMPKPIARPYPIKPAGELYAEALLATGDAPGAVRAFQSALTRTPRRAASLIGLARAAEKSGRRAEAAKAAKEFLAVWRLADAGRPELAEARGIAQQP
jgi:predicted Zn-dependent protease